MRSWNFNFIPGTWPRTWLPHKRSKARSPEAPPPPPEFNQFPFGIFFRQVFISKYIQCIMTDYRQVYNTIYILYKMATYGSLLTYRQSQTTVVHHPSLPGDYCKTDRWDEWRDGGSKNKVWHQKQCVCSDMVCQGITSITMFFFFDYLCQVSHNPARNEENGSNKIKNRKIMSMIWMNWQTNNCAKDQTKQE